MTDLTIDQDYCLEFYYHMHGSDIGELTVTVDIDAQPLFTIQDGRT